MTLPTISYQNKYDDEFLFLLLCNRFNTLCDAIEANYGCYINPMLEIAWLRRQYLNKSRHYHNIRHISFMLELYDLIKNEIQDVDKRLAMQWAIIYHDIIYIADRGDDFNIQSSIDVALYPIPDALFSISDDERLSGFKDLVREYIMATHHFKMMENENERMSQSIEAKYISDLDLYGFALPYSTFSDNTSKIRKEFSHLTDDKFYMGQKEFLKSILKLKNIFLTKFFGKFENDARKNIESLILS